MTARRLMPSMLLLADCLVEAVGAAGARAGGAGPERHHSHQGGRAGDEDRPAGVTKAGAAGIGVAGELRRRALAGAEDTVEVDQLQLRPPPGVPTERGLRSRALQAVAHR